MIDIKSISMYTDDEFEEDTELREELLNELKDVSVHINGGKSLQEACTHDLFIIYKVVAGAKK
jgi:hypothetical protein